MLLRWIHIIWSYFWFTVILIVSTASLFIVIGWALIQFNPVQDYIANKVESGFNERFDGTLTIGSLDGLLPFSISLSDISVVNNRPGIEPDTVLYAEEMNIKINYQALLSGQFRIDTSELIKPNIFINIQPNGSSNFAEAFREKTLPLDVLDAEQPKGVIDLPRFFLSTLLVTEGRLRISGLQTGEDIQLPETLHINDLNLSLGAEITDEIQFLNIYKLGFSTPQLQASEWNIRGQLFSDDRFLEFNAFKIESNQNSLTLNLSFDGVDIRKPGTKNQIMDSFLNLDAELSSFNMSELSDFIPTVSGFDEPISIELNADGTFSSLNVNRLFTFTESSQIRLSASLADLTKPESFSYKAELEYLNISWKDLQTFRLLESDFKFKEWSGLNVRGQIAGTMESIKTNISITPPNGKLDINGSLAFGGELKYNGSVVASNILFKDFPSLGSPQSRFNGSFTVSGTGLDFKKMNTNLKLNARNSRFREVAFEAATVDITIENGFLEPDFVISHSGGSLSGSGWIDLMEDDWVTQLSGEVRQFNTAAFLKTENAPESDLNIRYSVRFTGHTLDRLYGDLYVDIRESMYRGLEVEDHEIIVTLDSPDTEQRTLSINGTLLEANITGDLVPTRIAASVDYWIEEITELVQQRTVFKDFEWANSRRASKVNFENDDLDLDLDIKLRVDNLSLLHTFIPEFPLIETITNLDLIISSDSRHITATGIIASDFLQMEGIEVDSLSLTFNSTLRNDTEFDFFKYNLDSKFRSLSVSDVTIDNADISIDGYDEAFVLEHFRAGMGNDIRIGLALSSVFSTYDVDIRIMDFFVGDQDYSWTNSSFSPIVIDRSGRIKVQQLEFANANERVLIDGTFSENAEDSVAYYFNNFQLRTISDLIDGDVRFLGELNGQFQTRSLKTEPQFQGDIRLTGVEVDDRVVGDIDFVSSYNNEKDQFDIDMQIFTDPSMYRDYLQKSMDVGMDVDIKGYVKTPGSALPGEPLASLNINLQELDLWVLPYFVSGIFDDISGKTTGMGTFELYEDSFAYNARFTLTNVIAVPVFLESKLTLNGNIDLNTEDGVVLRNVAVRDEFGGSGRLNGSILVGDFATEMPMDITLTMNRLQFLNNDYKPETPFFGRVSGTGTLRLTGTDRSPFISTSEPIYIASNSNISIPIETESYIDERARFIRFVEHFDEAFRPVIDVRDLSKDERPELSFMEQFQLDLQFVASENMNVRLVFDQVTSEILNARGNGRIRLTLQDEEFRVFGRFDVSGGDYNFVGGDIFSRRFIIRDGGSISWDGDPVNARVDVTASYRARPDISILRPDVGENLRVPIELILVITGTLEIIENDFYFEFPSGVDGSQSTTYLALLNSEDQKLLQATSLLFTGNFIRLAGDSRDTGSTFQDRAGQIGLGTLLSSQINNLLNSNLSNLDIDFNLTGLDQADLGVALRLFDDRLTLRREGVVTGPDANLGDFDITYRINRYFSLEVFHRRDPLLPGIITAGQNQFESVNGIGLEAKVQYNTWAELKRRIWFPIKETFTVEQKDGNSKEEIEI